MVTAAQEMAQALVEAGIDHMFCVPGGGAGIIDAFFGKEDKMKIVLARHEQHASIMADAYGRLTGRPAVLAGQGPFIGTNGSFGIMEAYMSHSPMVVITDTSDQGFWQLGNYQNVSGEYGAPDLLTMMRAMTKYATLATTPNEAVFGTQLAIKHAMANPPGPAAVLLRSNVPSGRVDPQAQPRAWPFRSYVSQTELAGSVTGAQQTAEALSKAQRPVIIAGRGAHIARAYQEVRELAELFAIPVTTTYKGRGVIEETHPLAVGPMGIYGLDIANRMVSQADVVLVVGSRLRAHDTVFHHPELLNPHRQQIVQIDIEPRNVGWTVPATIGLVGDAKAVLRQVLELARQQSIDSDERQRRIALLASDKKSFRFFEDSPGLYSDQSPLLPQRLVRLLQGNVEPSTIIALDAGNNRLWMHHFYKCQRPATILGPGGHGGMGWAIPAAMAAKIVHPDMPVMAVTGDGGFGMTCNAISTAVQYNLSVVIVVFNDGALGMVRERQRPNVIASEFASANHAKICQAFGGWGVQVDSPQEVPAAIRDAFRAGQPAVVDVVIDQAEGFQQYQSFPERWLKSGKGGST